MGSNNISNFRDQLEGHATFLEERLNDVPKGLDFTETREERKKRIKLLAEGLYKPTSRKQRLVARATVRRALKRIKI